MDFNRRRLKDFYRANKFINGFILNEYSMVRRSTLRMTLGIIGSLSLLLSMFFPWWGFSMTESTPMGTITGTLKVYPGHIHIASDLYEAPGQVVIGYEPIDLDIYPWTRFTLPEPRVPLYPKELEPQFKADVAKMMEYYLTIFHVLLTIFLGAPMVILLLASLRGFIRSYSNRWSRGGILLSPVFLPALHIVLLLAPPTLYNILRAFVVERYPMILVGGKIPITVLLDGSLSEITPDGLVTMSWGLGVGWYVCLAAGVMMIIVDHALRLTMRGEPR
jgi:hypothetical protein